MRANDRVSSKRLNDFWNARVRRDQAEPDGLDPALVETMRRIEAFWDTPAPTSRFVIRLEEALMHEVAIGARHDFRSSSTGSALNGQSARHVEPAAPRWIEGTARGRMARFVVAAALLLLLLGLGSIEYRLAPGSGNHAAIPAPGLAVQGTPVASPRAAACGVPVSLGVLASPAAVRPRARGGTAAAGTALAGTPTLATASGTPATMVTIDAYEMYFRPAEVMIRADSPIRLTLANKGQVPHAFAIDALGLAIGAAPGHVATATISAPAGTYQFYDCVPGHKEAGMVGEVVAVAAATPAP